MSSLGKRAGNNALNANPNTFEGGADSHITTHGSDWYFAVCAVMTVATFAFLGLAAMKPRRDRIFFYITAGVTMVASVAYFTMGANLGWVPIPVEYVRGGKEAGLTREIFYVRYIDWVITTPLLLLDLLLTAGMPWPTILWVILVDEVMIITGLIGALVESSYKWAYFVFADLALFYIMYQLIWSARRHANVLGKDVGRVFLATGSLTAFLWLLYPIAWGLSEGGNVISSDGEAAFYGVLDLLAKPVFGAMLIAGHWKIDPARLGLSIHEYTEEDHPLMGTNVGEKHHHTNGTNGVTNGTNGVTNGTTAAYTNGSDGVTSGNHGHHGIDTATSGVVPAAQTV